MKNCNFIEQPCHSKLDTKTLTGLDRFHGIAFIQSVLKRAGICMGKQRVLKLN
jgi:hypothetical protein